MSEFNWGNIDRISRLTNRNTQDVIRLIGEEVQRQKDRGMILDARNECLERSDRYNTRRVDELELAVIKHRYYLLLSCAFDALILVYLFWGKS